MKVKKSKCYSCLTLCDPVVQPGLLCPWDSPGRNTGVGCHALQRIFPTKGSNPGLFCIAGEFFLSSEPLGKPKLYGKPEYFINSVKRWL